MPICASPSTTACTMPSVPVISSENVRSEIAGKTPEAALQQVSDVALAGHQLDMATLQRLEVREFRQCILAGGVLNAGVFHQQLPRLRCPDAAAVSLQQVRRYLFLQQRNLPADRRGIDVDPLRRAADASELDRLAQVVKSLVIKIRWHRSKYSRFKVLQ